MTAFDDLLAALVNVPRLDGAACTDDPPLFDDERRASAAVAVCNGCPALEACRAWVNNLPPSKRPHGVVAGKVSS